MLNSKNIPTGFDPVLNPGQAQPEDGECLRDQRDSFDALFTAFQRKHALARTRAEVEQDSCINDIDKASLLQDLQALETTVRRQLILYLHRNNRRQEIETLIAQPGRLAYYFPEEGFYIDRVAGGVHFLD